MSRKLPIIVAAVGAVCFLGLVIVFLINGDKSSPDSISVVGSWYSNKPDKVTFKEDGTYHFESWQSGNPYLSFDGEYHIDGSTLILESQQDGKTTFEIRDENGTLTLVGKYTYYQSEDAALQIIAEEEKDTQEQQENIVPDTTDALIGRWISLDGTTSCVFTENEITIDFKGNEVLPAETLHYTYSIDSDKHIKKKKNGTTAAYTYSLTQDKDGNDTFFCNAIDYAPTYIRDTGSTAGEMPVSTPDSDNGKQVNPDLSSHAEEMSNYVNEMLVGAWKGSFDEWETENTKYWMFSFTKDGKYTYFDGETEETGVYSVTTDPTQIEYHSEIKLDAAESSRTLKFYLTSTFPAKMVTNDTGIPALEKQ